MEAQRFFDSTTQWGKSVWLYWSNWTSEAFSIYLSLAQTEMPTQTSHKGPEPVGHNAVTLFNIFITVFIIRGISCLNCRLPEEPQRGAVSYSVRLIDLDFADMRPLSSARLAQCMHRLLLSVMLTLLRPKETRRVLFKMRGASCGAYRLVEAAQVSQSLAAATIHHVRQPWLGDSGCHSPVITAQSNATSLTYELRVSICFYGGDSLCTVMCADQPTFTFALGCADQN